MSNIEFERPAGKQQHTKSPTEKDPSLKGTLVSVMLLGGFIILSWFTVFIIFISRS